MPTQMMLLEHILHCYLTKKAYFILATLAMLNLHVRQSNSFKIEQLTSSIMKFESSN